MELRFVDGWDTQWKILERVQVVGMCGLEFRCGVTRCVIFPIDDDQRVRNGVPTWEGIRSRGFNHRDMEHWMNRMHALWQMKGERMSTSLGDDGKRIKELL